MDNSQRAIKADSPPSQPELPPNRELARARHDGHHGKTRRIASGLYLEETGGAKPYIEHVAGVRGRPGDLPNPLHARTFLFPGSEHKYPAGLNSKYHPGTAPRGGKERKGEGRGYDVLSGCSTRTLLRHSASPTQITISIPSQAWPPFSKPRAGAPAFPRVKSAPKACVVGVSNLERLSALPRPPPGSAHRKKGSGGPEDDVLTPSVDPLARAHAAAHAGEAIIPHS
ncbi:hypothetical protein CCUS01_00481 [Colletotrichum cuscutae]|uniref:Uncharacterized protein n=1 Tax=Colletotrichum cuscutae TaxID=1209917 RepID=A0AAI9Y2X4_9PEZI|nr:hypothetical protein CCUS01_00481 [Colletotrichum cuscutae]